MLNPNKDNYYLEKYNAIMGDLPNVVKEEKIRKTFDGVIEPRFPDLNEDIKTVLGIDENANGIRDDIEIWINRKFKSYNHRQALKAYIKAMNSATVMGLQKNIVTYSELRKLYVEKEQALQCYLVVSGDLPSTAKKDLDKLYLNTYLRKRTYEAYINKVLSTQGHENNLQRIKFPKDGNQILDSCAFKVENRNLIYENFPAYMKK